MVISGHLGPLDLAVLGSSGLLRGAISGQIRASLRNPTKDRRNPHKGGRPPILMETSQKCTFLIEVEKWCDGCARGSSGAMSRTRKVGAPQPFCRRHCDRTDACCPVPPARAKRNGCRRPGRVRVEGGGFGLCSDGTAKSHLSYGPNLDNRNRGLPSFNGIS